VAHIAGITRIGRVTESGRLNCLLNGDIVEIDDSGYRHFQ
jgi:thiamine monophosphate kinase